MKESNAALYEAYTTLPEFREYLIDDILERTYQDVATDTRTSVEQHEHDSAAPVWVTEKAQPEEPEKPETTGRPGQIQTFKLRLLRETLSHSPKQLSKLPGRATQRR